ncbi:MAG TPA: hypothetical protein VMB53_12830 [Gaiellaceae bacterium]|nr:hypothetical protein [Gaiellaceae bacterium]
MKLLTLFLIVAVAAIVASASQATRLPNNPQTRALMIDGDGLNKIYHLGTYSSSASVDAQNRAIRLRSIALNRTYHLGAFASK